MCSIAMKDTPCKATQALLLWKQSCGLWLKDMGSENDLGDTSERQNSNMFGTDVLNLHVFKSLQHSQLIYKQFCSPLKVRFENCKQKQCSSSHYQDDQKEKE